MSNPDSAKNVPQFLDRRAAAEFIGLSDFWLAKHKSDPDAPPYIVYGRKCWYRLTDLKAWVEERKRRAADPDAGLNDIWEQSAERKTATPDEAELSAYFEMRHGTEPASVLVARAVERVRKLSPGSLKILMNTLNLLESSPS